jgi:histidine triad (HIT) family protein
MASLFTKIIEGEIPSHRVYEDAYTFAFLDINPRQAGHTLVVPKREVDYLFDLPAEDYTALWAAVHTVSTAIKETTGCARVVVIVLGYEVPHAHVHLIPTDDMSQIPFPAVDETAQGHLAETAELLRSSVTARHVG